MKQAEAITFVNTPNMHAYRHPQMNSSNVQKLIIQKLPFQFNMLPYKYLKGNNPGSWTPPDITGIICLETAQNVGKQRM